MIRGPNGVLMLIPENSEVDGDSPAAELTSLIRGTIEGVRNDTNGTETACWDFLGGCKGTRCARLMRGAAPFILIRLTLLQRIVQQSIGALQNSSSGAWNALPSTLSRWWRFEHWRCTRNRHFPCKNHRDPTLFLTQNVL